MCQGIGKAGAQAFAALRPGLRYLVSIFFTKRMFQR